MLWEEEAPLQPIAYSQNYDQELFPNEVYLTAPEENAKPMGDVEVLLHVIINRIDSLQAVVETLHTRQDVKKPRKARTMINRCIHKNRKFEPCRSYICKNSKSLCHAHHSLYHSPDQNYLYGHK